MLICTKMMISTRILDFPCELAIAKVMADGKVTYDFIRRCYDVIATKNYMSRDFFYDTQYLCKVPFKLLLPIDNYANLHFIWI